MQIQRINNNNFGHAPNFEANKLKTITIAANSLKKQSNSVDIYSVNQNDEKFLKELLAKINLKERNDNAAISEKERVNDALNYVITKARHIGVRDKETCLIAVENNKSIVGMLNFLSKDAPFLKNLVVWNSKNVNVIRSALLTQFINKAERINRNRHCSNFANAVVYSVPGTKGTLLLSKFGFKKQVSPIKSARIKMEIKAQDLKNALKIAEQKLKMTGNIEVKTLAKPEVITLSNLEI